MVDCVLTELTHSHVSANQGGKETDVRMVIYSTIFDCLKVYVYPCMSVGHCAKENYFRLLNCCKCHWNM